MEENKNSEEVSKKFYQEEQMGDYVHKKVMAADLYKRTKDWLMCLAVMFIMTFLCAAAGKNWYSILFGALSIGWGLVFLVRTVSFRTYLEKTYGVKE